MEIPLDQLKETANSAGIWSTSLVEALAALWVKVAEFVPNLVAFLVILIIGYAISRLVQSGVRRALRVAKIDAFSERLGISSVLRRANIQQETSFIISKIFFWLLMLTFLVSATESLGLPRVSSNLDNFVRYIPKVLGAAFILMVGLFIAQFVRDLVVRGAEGIGSEFAGPLGTASHGLLVIVVMSLVIGQLEIETELLNVVISIGLLSLGTAAALAFGLGSKEVAANVLAGSYVRNMYHDGDDVTIMSVRGKISHITAVKTEIMLENGDIHSFANSVVIENNVVRHK
jgi:small-conductance mechanosensitive channel